MKLRSETSYGFRERFSNGIKDRKKVIKQLIDKKKRRPNELKIGERRLPAEKVKLNNLRQTEEEERIENQLKYTRAFEKTRKRNMSEYIKRVEELNMNDGNISENWRRFKRNFDIFSTAIGLDEKTDVVKINTFLNAIGPNAVDVYDTFNLTQMERTTYVNVIAAFEDFCKAQKNTVYEIYIFNQRNQREGEPFDSYLMEIKQLVKTCEFGEKETEMLRDRIVVGIIDKQLQTRLLETKELTYEKAIEKCRASEATKQQSRELNKIVTMNEIRSQRQSTQMRQPNGTSANNNNGYRDTEREERETQQRNNNQHLNNRRNDTNDKFHCRFCNFVHRNRECPAYGKTCNTCSKKNHFSSVCRTRSVSTIERSNNYNPELNSQDNNDNDEFYIGCLENRFNIAKNEAGFMSPWLEKVDIGNKSVMFKIDTGAEIDVLPLSLVRELFPRAEVKYTNITLKAFGGEKIKPVGMCYLSCCFRNIALSLFIAVVDIDITPILGLTSCAKFGIVNPPRTKPNETKMTKNQL